MIEDLLNNQENSKSILIVDNFENQAQFLLCSFVNNLLQKDLLCSLYPTSRKSYLNFEQLFNNLIIDKYLLSFDSLCFKTLLNNLNNNQTTSPKKKWNLIFDNLNLLIRALDNNPFRLVRFIVECNKRSDINSIIFLLHEDSLEDSIINQLKLVFQTTIHVKDTKLKQNDLTLFSKLNKQIFKFDLNINNRSFKTGKILNYQETVYLSEDFEIKKLDKHVKSAKSKIKTEADEGEDEMLKGLTFNVHLNPDDLEAKKNLVLPYELLGQHKIQPKLEPNKQEESKIYYAPDERDDVDDDDPDDDLNF